MSPCYAITTPLSSFNNQHISPPHEIESCARDSLAVLYQELQLQTQLAEKLTEETVLS